jgi:hypothetical protein
MNPMRSTKLTIGELMDDGRSIWRLAGFVAGCAVLGFGLAAGLTVAAQEPDPAPQAGLTNEATAAEVLARLSEMVQPDDSAQPEDMGAPDDLTGTNGLPQANPSDQVQARPASSNRFANPNQTQTDDRRSRGRRSFRSRSGQSGSSASGRDYSQAGDRYRPNTATGTNGSPAGLDYAAFRIIVDRNIFDPNRYPRGPGARPSRATPRSVDSLTLVGTMSYDKGTFAFFDGTSADYRKALKLNDVILGYKVTHITSDSVQLAAGTNELALRVGMQLRREEDGPWRLSGQSDSYTALPTSASSNAAASTGPDASAGGAESDIIKKLRLKREQE